MPPSGRMQHLTSVSGSFHGRVLAARLGAEGVLVELRGLSEGPYPLQGLVGVWVQADQLELAREILLADAVEEAFATDAEPDDSLGAEPDDSPDAERTYLRGLAAATVICVAILLVIVAVVAAGA